MATHSDKDVYLPAITDGLPATSFWQTLKGALNGLVTRGSDQITTRTGDFINWR